MISFSRVSILLEFPSTQLILNAHTTTSTPSEAECCNVVEKANCRKREGMTDRAGFRNGRGTPGYRVWPGLEVWILLIRSVMLLDVVALFRLCRGNLLECLNVRLR